MATCTEHRWRLFRRYSGKEWFEVQSIEDDGDFVHVTLGERDSDEYDEIFCEEIYCADCDAPYPIPTGRYLEVN